MNITVYAPKRKVILEKSLITVLNLSENRSVAERVVKERGGMLPSVKELILAIRDPVQYEQLKGDVYWTRDEGLEISRYCRIDSECGTVSKVSELEFERLPLEQRAYARSGSGPVAFLILPQSHRGKWRFCIDADTKSGSGPIIARLAYVNPVKAKSEIRRT